MKINPFGGLLQLVAVSLLVDHVEASFHQGSWRKVGLQMLDLTEKLVKDLLLPILHGLPHSRCEKR